MALAAVHCGAQRGRACSAAAEDAASWVDRAPTGAGFGWGCHCWGNGPMAEGQGLFWGEDGAALGTGWEAKAKKGPRGRG